MFPAPVYVFPGLVSVDAAMIDLARAVPHVDPILLEATLVPGHHLHTLPRLVRAPWPRR